MPTELDAHQRLHMREHQEDVRTIVDVLASYGEEVGQTDAYLLWANHSERSSAGWLRPERGEDGEMDILSALHSHQRAAVREPEPVRAATLSDVAPPGERIPGERETAQMVSSLRAIGFAPSSQPPRDASTLNRMSQLAGRLSNVAYMANAIDALDGVPPAMRAPSVPGGERQLQHMMADRLPGIGDAARCYVALRRAQRAGDDVRLRTGLVMLVAADKGEIGFADVLSSLGDDGRPLANQVARSGAKGGPDASEAAPIPARTADRGR